MAEDRYLSILRQYWEYPDFRGIQREIIKSIGSGHDTLGLMPTGGGKSITFQVPALAKDGVCIVITPLIALMKDQVKHLHDKGISAAAIYSGMSRREIVVALENCIFGGIKLLYISPERLNSDLFQNKLRRIKVSFITVDEAHCISQWGYDFRPSYLHIADIRILKPGVPILALTATATTQVVEDIQNKLNFKHKNVFRMSFERKNLTYVVRNTTDKHGELIHILNAVQGSAIVYVRSRKRSKEISDLLNKHNIQSTFFHAGLEYSQKDERQKSWQEDQIRVIVATNAFGMGIDKSEVRLVIHFDCPDSLEAYFQEAGRAGRDEHKAYAVLLYNNSDQRKLYKRIADTFPEKDFIKQIYEHLAYFYQIGLGSGVGHVFSFDIDKFCRTYKHFPIQTDTALKILERSGYLNYERDPDSSARLMFMLTRDELYKLENTTPHEELVITALLRNYGGLFTDYVYIDEGLIAQQSGLTQQQIYLLLKGLSQRRILHFIPQRKTPYITYTQRREEMNRIIIPQEVYEIRKEQYILRIQAMIQYAKNDNICRSGQLLRYFGEKKSKDCMQCDVCLEHYTNQSSASKIKPAKNIVTTFLHDGKKHHITELHQLNIPKRQLHSVLKELVTEEKLTMEQGSFLLLKT